MRVKGSTLVMGTAAYLGGLAAVAHTQLEGGLGSLFGSSSTSSPGSASSSHVPGHDHHHHHHRHGGDSGTADDTGSRESHPGDWRAQAAESREWRRYELGAVPDEERRRAFDAGAREYDDEIGSDETVMGLRLMRRALVRHAQGKVLEIAAGTGRNFDYYDLDRCHVLAVDSSEGMIKVAATKVLDFKPAHQKKIECYVARPGARLQFEDNSFYTVVDTFGLCSFEDPVESLREMQRVCRPDGRILLLEHGRSTWGWLNDQLDQHAYRHAKRWGCWWNRDIEEILRESDLEIEYTTRWHFGTTHYVIAKGGCGGGGGLDTAGGDRRDS